MYHACLLILDSDDPFIATADDSMRLNRWLFACAVNPIQHVMTAGRWVIQGGRHRDAQALTQKFITVLRELTD